jgi:hypothetical protein
MSSSHESVIIEGGDEKKPLLYLSVSNIASCVVTCDVSTISVCTLYYITPRFFSHLPYSKEKETFKFTL